MPEIVSTKKFIKEIHLCPVHFAPFGVPSLPIPSFFVQRRDWLSRFTNSRKAPALPSGNWREKERPV